MMHQITKQLDQENDSETIATRQRYLLVFLLFLHTVNTYMDRVCISVAKGSMQNDIEGLDDQMMGYVFGIFAVGYALFQIPSGWLSDRVGPRRALTIVVVIWSIFTALTGAVHTAVLLLIVRFLFGVGEAGAYPGATRALYSWLPPSERGLGQGIFHSGARIGAALSLLVMPWLIGLIGWRWTFVANGGIGFIWAAIWWFWFRNQPHDHPWTNKAETAQIEHGLEEAEATTQSNIPFIQLVTSANILLAMFQYAASNVTFFWSITWLRPFIVEKWGEDAANLSAIPLFVGAVSLWFSGSLVTYLYRIGLPVVSRRLPAMIGFGIGVIGLLLCTQTSIGDSAGWFIVTFSIAIFGVEMVLSPSWAFCMDIGGKRSGAVSASMNMVGNLGAAMSAVIYPYLFASVTLPLIAPQIDSPNSFFAFAAAFNLLAMLAWIFMNPTRQLDESLSKAAIQRRVIFFVVLIILVMCALVYKTFFLG